jgi:hypothetical protein
VGSRAATFLRFPQSEHGWTTTLQVLHIALPSSHRLETTRTFPQTMHGSGGRRLCSQESQSGVSVFAEWHGLVFPHREHVAIGG